MVDQFVRVLVGVNLQQMKSILNNPTVWQPFALACDGSTHNGIPFFDVRTRTCIEGDLYNLHLGVVPFFDRHTAENTVNLIKKLLDNLCVSWRDKVIAISTDGEVTNTGWRNGVVARLDRMATHKLMRIWCAPHQGDIVIRAATNQMDNGAFYKTAHAFSVHLRQQNNLILEMQVQCPRDTNRWADFERILTFMLKHRRRLDQRVQEKNPPSAPSASWWVTCAAVQPLAELCNMILQSRDMILWQQMKEIENLVKSLMSTMDIEAIQIDETYSGLPDSEYQARGKHWIRMRSVEQHISDQVSWARDSFNALSAHEQAHVLREISEYKCLLLIFIVHSDRFL